MKKRLDRHQENLTAEERESTWLRVRPRQAEAHRVITIRRWSLSFGLAAVGVALVAVIVAERNSERARRAERESIVEVPMGQPHLSGPISPEQLREIAFSLSTDGVLPEAGSGQNPGPFVNARDDSTSSYALVVGRESYASTQRYVAAGSLPPPGEVRIEEFVNAFGQGYPEFDSPDLRVFVDGAPSPFGDRCQLVRVGLKARAPVSPDSVEIIAEGASVQVTFNPRAVKRYRLIGFDKAGIRREASAAGAAIAAGYEIAALYEIEPRPGVKDADLLEVRVRYSAPPGRPASSSGGAASSAHGPPTRDGQSHASEIEARLLSSDINPMFAMAPARFRLAAAAAEFAEILRGRPWTKEHRIGEVLLMAEGLATEIPGDERLREFAALVRRSAEIRGETTRPAPGS